MLSTKVDAQGETTADMSTNVNARSRATIDRAVQKIKNENRKQGNCPQPGREKNAWQQGAARTAHGAEQVTLLAAHVEGRKTTGRVEMLHRTVGVRRRHPLECAH